MGSPRTGITELHVVRQGTLNAIPRLRHVVVELARGRVASERLADLALVTSEVLTNALEHGAPSSGIVADVRESNGAFVVSVGNDVELERPPPLDEWQIADRHSLSGRGLGVVRRLAPGVSLVDDGRRVTVTTSWPLAR